MQKAILLLVGDTQKLMREVLYKHFVFGRVGGIGYPPGFCGVCT